MADTNSATRDICKHSARKNTSTAMYIYRDRSYQLIAAILTEENEKQSLNLHVSKCTCLTLGSKTIGVFFF